MAAFATTTDSSLIGWTTLTCRRRPARYCMIASVVTNASIAAMTGSTHLLCILCPSYCHSNKFPRRSDLLEASVLLSSFHRCTRRIVLERHCSALILERPATSNDPG